MMETANQLMPQQSAVQSWEDQKSLAQRINRMLDVQRNVMKPEVDYGRIPGCDKPTLLKPGAELLCMTFRVGDRMSPGYPMKEVDHEGNITFTVIMEFYDQATGITIGQGMGVASTAEEKYAWRKSVCDAEWNDQVDYRRRVKYYKDGGTQKQVHTNPKDMENTVAKMAKKRAKVDGCLNVLAASRVFAQDLEDLPEGMEQQPPRQSTKPQVSMPTARHSAAASGDAVITEAQAKRLYAMCKKSGADVDCVKNWLKVKMQIDGFQNIPRGHYEAICAKVEKDPKAFEPFSPGNKPSGPEHSEFVGVVESIGKKKGLIGADLIQVLEENFDFKSLEDVPEGQQSAVIDFFSSLGDNAHI